MNWPFGDKTNKNNTNRGPHVTYLTIFILYVNMKIIWIKSPTLTAKLYEEENICAGKSKKDSCSVWTQTSGGPPKVSTNQA